MKKILKNKKLIAIFSVILTLLIIFIILSKSTNVFSKNRKLPIYCVDKDSKEIAISFDCAWGVQYTDKLLKIMQEEGVKCTFFAVEFWTMKYPEYVKKIDECGHEIGTHSKTHPHMSKLDKSTIIKELESSKLAIEKITGKKVKVFRPPFGDYNDLLIETCEELKLYPIQWDVDSLDWKDLSANEIKERVLKRVKNGSIVLFHNNGLHTSEALRDIIVTLKNEGYTFKTVYDLIYKDNYTIDSNGKQKSYV